MPEVRCRKRFTTTDTNLYDPLVTLSTQDNVTVRTVKVRF